MKGRADDRRLFERGVTLNVMAFVDSVGFDAERLAQGVKLADYGLQLGDLTELRRLFEHATTFGSLIQVPEKTGGEATGAEAVERRHEPRPVCVGCSHALGSAGTAGRDAGGAVRRCSGESAV